MFKKIALSACLLVTVLPSAQARDIAYPCSSELKISSQAYSECRWKLLRNLKWEVNVSDDQECMTRHVFAEASADAGHLLLGLAKPSEKLSVTGSVKVQTICSPKGSIQKMIDTDYLRYILILSR